MPIKLKQQKLFLQADVFLFQTDIFWGEAVVLVPVLRTTRHVQDTQIIKFKLQNPREALSISISVNELYTMLLRLNSTRSLIPAEACMRRTYRIKPSFFCHHLFNSRTRLLKPKCKQQPHKTQYYFDAEMLDHPHVPSGRCSASAEGQKRIPGPLQPCSNAHVKVYVQPGSPADPLLRCHLIHISAEALHKGKLPLQHRFNNSKSIFPCKQNMKREVRKLLRLQEVSAVFLSLS